MHIGKARPVPPSRQLVVMAGLAWNPPTSCAWAARVYVNNKEARNHGLAHVGLPSRLADFRHVGCSASTERTEGTAGPHALTVAENSGEDWWRGGGGKGTQPSWHYTCMRTWLHIGRLRSRGWCGVLVT